METERRASLSSGVSPAGCASKSLRASSKHRCLALDVLNHGLQDGAQQVCFRSSKVILMCLMTVKKEEPIGHSEGVDENAGEAGAKERATMTLRFLSGPPG